LPEIDLNGAKSVADSSFLKYASDKKNRNMALADHLNVDPDRLSATSRRMLELRETVLAEWEKRVRASVNEAASLNHPILINTFPLLYNNIAEALTPDYPRPDGIDKTTVATEHGSERARLTGYSPQAIISEYQILRWTLLDVLKQNGLPLRDGEILTINASIDGAIREAITAFGLVQSAFRERFVAALTHDLRNPLTTANAAAELILRIADSPKIKNFAAKIIENHLRMDRMIQDLLDTVVFQTGERLRLHLSNFDILDVVNEVYDQSTTTYGPRFMIFGEAVKGWWGRDPIKRALENLVGNAVKYGAPDTPIHIKVDMSHERVILSVHNKGDPIPPDQLESIFQVFRRAEAAKEGNIPGWGIGLPYVRSVAESHGGSVGADSSTERGTTFSIDIPVDARPYLGAPTFS
jgi:signal transduction histidine kinase